MYDARCACTVGRYAEQCPIGAEVGNHPRSPLEAGMAAVWSFRGKFAFLSNFYPWVDRVRHGPDICVVYDGEGYPTSEHAFVAAKTLALAERRRVAALPYPGIAKRAGHALPLREDWERVKVGVMFTVVLDKFVRNPELRADLLATGDAPLYEGNTWGDTFWGVVSGAGRNELGKALMAVRATLRGAP